MIGSHKPLNIQGFYPYQIVLIGYLIADFMQVVFSSVLAS